MMVMGSANGGSPGIHGSNAHDMTSSSSTIGALNIMSVSDSVTQIPSVTLNSPLSSANLLDPIERQSLKHLSVSAPAIKSAVIMGTSSSDNEFMFAPTSSKSRQKKFHRHFSNVPPEEKVLDYYSCALVADILLQGYLYITENYFAFYSNVFGYVTKVLVPVCTIVKISKEKTAKIIPNAVGICTRTEKHVFASLISRDTTYKLMCKVWNYTIDNEAKLVQKLTKVIPQDDKGSGGDMSIPDESSGESGSGNDSAVEPISYDPSPLNTPIVDKIKILGTSLTNTAMIGNIPVNNEGANNGELEINIDSSKLSNNCDGKLPQQLEAVKQITPTVTTTLPSYVRIPVVPRPSISQVNKAPVNLASAFSKENRKHYLSTITTGLRTTQSGHTLLLLATIILVILFLSAALLLSRISALQNKLSERPVFQDSDQFYQELLTWQNKLHSSSAEEIHQYINMNLKQIVRVRQALEALSLLFMSSHSLTSPINIGDIRQTASSQQHDPSLHLNHFGQVNQES